MTLSARRTRRSSRHAAVVVVAGLSLLATAPAPAYPSADISSQDSGTATPWQAPVPGQVVRSAELPAKPWQPGHRGIDLAAAAGTAVRAPTAGTVTFAGRVAGRPVMVVSHGALRSTLEPVEAVVAVGSGVGPGDQVGVLADPELSHCAPAGCVHWGVRRGELYLDPATLLGDAEPIVLLPG